MLKMEGNVKICLREIRWKILDWIYVARCGDRWWAFVCAGIKFVLSKMGEVS
jgi:hypothetical protein